MVVIVRREEPSPLPAEENLQSVERWLRWFKRDGEEMVGETQLRGVSLSQLKQVFVPCLDDPLMYYCYPVETAEQIKLLSSWLDGEVNLEAYEYFVECNNSEG